MNLNHTHLKPEINFKYEPVQPKQKRAKKILMSELTFNLLTTCFLYAMAVVGIVSSAFFFFKWLSTYW